MKSPRGPLHHVYRNGKYWMTLAATDAEDAIRQTMELRAQAGKPTQRSEWTAKEAGK